MLGDKTTTGYQLTPSVKIVSTHRRHIPEKMKTNAELTNYAIKQNLDSLTG